MDNLGSQFSLYPPSISDGFINIVSGERAINARLIHLLLLRKGEDPLHPDLGFAPDLFAPKSAQNPHVYSFELQNTLKKWNDRGKIGISSFSTEVFNPPTGNTIDIRIRYGIDSNRPQQVFSYGFWEYVEAFTTNDIGEYLESIRFS